MNDAGARDLWKHIRGDEHTPGIFSPKNYDPTNYDDPRKELVIMTFVHGPRAEFYFNAEVPRSANNELGMTKSWFPKTRTDAAAFLRELAHLIEKGTP